MALALGLALTLARARRINEMELIEGWPSHRTCHEGCQACSGRSPSPSQGSSAGSTEFGFVGLNRRA